MDLLYQFPESIQQFLMESYGKAVSINKLNGIKAEGGCYRVGFPHHSVIVKQMTKPQEYLFYNELSCLLQEFNRNIPALYWSYRNENSYWIVIEDIPNALPKERWQADEQVLEALFYLHAETWDKGLPVESLYIPKWDNRLTEAVLELFSQKTVNQVRPLLFEVQEEAKQLFKPCCWINSDTNPTNWGIRKDGTIVLFDWERISCGSPAIDLAITMPWLGSLDNSLELLIGKKYSNMWSKALLNFPLSLQELNRQIRLAKVWSVVEFMDNSWTSLDYDTQQKLLTGLSQKLYELSI